MMVSDIVWSNHRPHAEISCAECKSNFSENFFGGLLPRMRLWLKCGLLAVILTLFGLRLLSGDLSVDGSALLNRPTGQPEFVDVAANAGLTRKFYCGGETRN